jgi:hypothetical protein
MLRKIINFWSWAGHYTFIGFCLVGGTLFTDVALSTLSGQKVLISWAMAAIFFGLGLRYYDTRPPQYDDIEDGIPPESIPIYRAPAIEDNSWLADPKYDNFHTAYSYASSQAAAIPALAKITPEELYNVTYALNKGGLSWKDAL